jgi:hypothetical protein
LETRGCRFFRQASPVELATEEFEPVGGIAVSLKGLFAGYILTDLKKNLESGTVAVTAAHIYNGIIVDCLDQEKFEKAGYKMLYDASGKKVRDASALKKSENDNDIIIRMVETFGKDTFTTLRSRSINLQWSGNIRGCEIKTLKINTQTMIIEDVNLLENKII